MGGRCWLTLIMRPAPNLTLGLYSHVPAEVDRAAAARLEDLLVRTEPDPEGTEGTQGRVSESG